MNLISNKAIIQEIQSNILNEKQVQLFIQRDDLLHAEVSGNKFRKLKYNLEQAKNQNFKTVLTFGGAYSNHIAATAAAAKIVGFHSIGIIRGEEHLPLNYTLQTAIKNGMQLYYVNRSDYKNKHKEFFLNQLKEQFGKVYIIPEGGTNELAVKGIAEMKELWKDNSDTMGIDYVACPFGSGGTSLGIYSILERNQKLLIFSALKGETVQKEFEKLLEEHQVNSKAKWEMIIQYHFGGYAKINTDLVDFVNQFKKEFDIQLDLIYNGKMLYGLFDRIRNNYFEKGSKILAIHTGGVQGNEGMKERYGIDLI